MSVGGGVVCTHTCGQACVDLSVRPSLGHIAGQPLPGPAAPSWGGRAAVTAGIRCVNFVCVHRGSKCAKWGQQSK